jgi:endo-alpha-1,4-polygalactosaminidase (GH114 family)
LNPKDPYLVYYGSWSDEMVKQVGEYFKLVILHSDRREIDPKTGKIILKDNVTREQLILFHNKGVKVFAYISIGEDSLTSVEQGNVKNPAKAEGKDTGPCYWDGHSFKNQKPKVTCENKKIARYYLDQKINQKEEFVKGDGKPDRNTGLDSGSLYVNPYDDTWQNLVEAEARRIMSLKIIGADGKEYNGYSGIFLDTLDMAAKTEYTWMQGGIRDLLVRLNNVTKNIIINRGLYFFEKANQGKPLTSDIEKLFWGVMFENLYTEKEGEGIPTPYIYKDHVKRLDELKAQVFVLDYLACSKMKATDPLFDEQKKSAAAHQWLNYVTWDLDKDIRYCFSCEQKPPCKITH